MKAKKPYQPEAFFQQVVNVHADWLFTMGYHERAMGMNDRPGRLVQSIKDFVVKAVVQTLWEYRIEAFEVGIRGVFSPKKDQVDFRLYYEWDPAKLELDLKKMEATMQDYMLTFEIHNNTRKELPPAATVHLQLATLKNKELLERIQQYNQKAFKKKKL